MQPWWATRIFLSSEWGEMSRRDLFRRNESFSDTDSDAGEQAELLFSVERRAASGDRIHSKGDMKWGKVVKRLIFGTLLIGTLCLVITGGHLWTLLLVQSASSSTAPATCTAQGELCGVGTLCASTHVP